MRTWSPTRQPPGPATFRERERAENFPVALSVLPHQLRADLRAVYRVVRSIDELGDSAPGDRTAQLTNFAADLSAVWADGDPQAGILRELVPTVRRRGLGQQPFQDLVLANLQDQEVLSYRSFDELLQYCALSAAPIGRLVLKVFGAAAPELVLLSDQVCCGLQLVEHWQDVAEDRRAGRIYLPEEDRRHLAVRETDLDADNACPALRRLVFFETGRTARMLDAGAPLVGQLHGWARLAVAGYVAGGRAAVDSVHRVQGDVLGCTPRVRRRDVARHLLAELRRAQ